MFFTKMIVETELFSEIDERKKELLILSALVHDIKKLGNNGSQYTTKDHPQLASEYITKLAKNNKLLTNSELKYCCDAIISHMGVFESTMPTPTTDPQKIVSIADYLASRKECNLNILSEEELKDNSDPMYYKNVLFENKNKEILETNNPEEFSFPFGKHKGHTLKEIAKTDPQYLLWIINNGQPPTTKVVGFLAGFIMNIIKKKLKKLL